MIPMATTYDEIRDIFLSKVTAFEFGKMTEPEANEIIDKYLKSATTKFKYCIQDLNNRDDINRKFNTDLTLEEQEILAMLMAIEWIGQKVLSEQNLRNVLGNKDYNVYSPANLLKEMSNLKRDLTNEVNSVMTLYHYTN